MAQADADRNLLFGILALQMDLITRDALVAAMNAWVLEKAKPLGQILTDRGDLDPADRALLEPMVRRHVDRHGGDPRESLAAMSSVAPVRNALASIDEPDLQASLAALRPEGSVGATLTLLPRIDSAASRFRILRPHARGGLGEVFVARDVELGRTVALKEIQLQHTHRPEFRSRFVLEAEINGNLEHPGIVPVYGLGSYADGRPFYAMRFIEGDSFKDAIARYHREAQGMSAADRLLGLRKLLGRFIDVCDAVAYAHSRGVLHRDLKPANVMLGRFGETLVVDWGLAKTIGSSEAEPAPDSGLTGGPIVPQSGASHEPTQAGSALGTPGFMSPEQADGRLELLGPATDVYSLGATLYCVLTGQAPLTGGDAIARAIRGDIPSPRSIRKEVPRALEAVALKALSLHPGDRYPSAAALRDDVERWLDDEPVSVGREPLGARARRWVRKHRTLSTTAAAVALVGLVALAAAYRREVRYASELAASGKESERWLDEAFQAIEAYYTDVGASVLRGRPDLADLQKKLLARPTAFYERLTSEYAASPPADDRGHARLARGRYSLGKIQHILGRNDEARVQFESALVLFAALVERRPGAPADLDGLATCRNDLGVVLRDTGHPAEAVESYGKSIAAFEALVRRRPDTPVYRDGLAGAYVNLGNVLGDTGRPAEAAAAYGQAVAIRADLVARRPDDPGYRDRLALSETNLGNLLAATGRPAEALAAFEKAIAVREDLVARHPDTPEYLDGLALSHNNLGVVLGNTGRPAGAAAEFGKAVAAYEILVKRQPDVPDYGEGLAMSQTNLGAMRLDEGRPAESAAAFAKAIAIRADLVARHPDVPDYGHGLAGSHTNLGKLLRQLDRPAEAVTAFEKAIAIRADLVARHPEVTAYRNGLARSRTNLGNALADAGRPAEAVAEYGKAIAAYEGLLARLPTDADLRNALGSTAYNLGSVLARQGRHEEAVARYREAIGHQRPVLDRLPRSGPLRRLLSGDYKDLAASLRALGRAGAAAEAARELVKLWPKDPAQLYDCACAFALCVPIAKEPAQKRSLSDEAMATLDAAVVAGYADGAWMSRDPDLIPLRGRDDFRRLVLRLMDRAMPADPFAPAHGIPLPAVSRPALSPRPLVLGAGS